MKRVQHAAAVTFLVYATITLLALIPTTPAVGALGVTVDVDPDGALLLERLRGAVDGLRAVAWTLAPVLVVGALLAPLLSMTWLAALARPRSVSDALREGASRYARAVLVSVVLFVPLLAVGALLAALPALAHLLFDATVDARAHDLALLGATLPGLMLLVAWSAWHDLSRAALATGGGGVLGAVRTGFRALGVKTVGVYLGLFAFAAVLGLAGHATGAALTGSGSLRGAAVLLLLQAFAAGRVWTRALWLGAALDRVAPRDSGTARLVPVPDPSPPEALEGPLPPELSAP